MTLAADALEQISQLDSSGAVLIVAADAIEQISLRDGEYDNELLLQIASESATFARLVQSSLQYLDSSGDNHLPTWLGSWVEDRPKTQVQLVVTQHPDFTIDED